MPHSSSWLALALLLIAGALFARYAHADSHEPPQPSDRQVERLQAELRGLIGQLDEIDELHREPDRGELVRRHWQAVQDYMRHVLAQLPPPPASAHASLGPYGSAAACRLATAMQSEAYVARMRDLLWSMREQLLAVHEAGDSARRQALLREHALSSYRGLQLLRGSGWTYESAAPAAIGNPPVPDSASEPAYLVRLYCGQCHAPPPPELHSAQEWSGVASRMQAHMNIADAGNSAEIRRPGPREAAVILGFLEANGCDADR
jgi:hypothetical protein